MELKGDKFHRRVRQGFLAQASNSPDQYAVIDASPDEKTVFARLMNVLKEKFGGSRGE